MIDHYLGSISPLSSVRIEHLISNQNVGSGSNPPGGACQICGAQVLEGRKTCSKTCANRLSIRNDSKPKNKIRPCIKCNLPVEVNKRTSANKTYCIACKEKYGIGEFWRNKIICKICGTNKCVHPKICRSQLFNSLIKYFGFNKTKIGTKEIYKEWFRIKSKLEKQYYEEELSTLDLCEQYSHPDVANFNKILDSLKIKKRTNSEAVRNAFLKGKLDLPISNRYCYGYHITWEKKKVFLRSSYELDYAKKLDIKKIKYDVEKFKLLYWDSQECKEKCCLPDFYLPETNTIVEIKSDFTLNLINMQDKIKAYEEAGYIFKLILEKKEVDIKSL